MERTLHSLREGAEFTAFGDQFIKLEATKHAVLCLRKETWSCKPFDANANNNLCEADIRMELSRYTDALIANGMPLEAYLEQEVNLATYKPMTHDYGVFRCVAGLLTTAQYGRYKPLMPYVPCWAPENTAWWLATPGLTKSDDGVIAHAWRVLKSGDTDIDYCKEQNGVRPTMLFNENINVTIVTE